MALAESGEVVTSDAVREMAAAGAELAFSPKGEYPLKGVPGQWKAYTFERGSPAK